MKFVILLAAVIAFAAVQGGHRPGFDHGDPLHHLINEEVQEIIRNNQGIRVDNCAAKCDNIFDLNAHHDKDRICHEECAHQLSSGGN